MRIAGLVCPSDREDDVAIEQLGFPDRWVVLYGERNVERCWLKEVDLGGSSQFGGQETADVAPETDAGQSANVAVDDHGLLA
jgi:hypothetical protein